MALTMFLKNALQSPGQVGDGDGDDGDDVFGKYIGNHLAKFGILATNNSCAARPDKKEEMSLL